MTNTDRITEHQRQQLAENIQTACRKIAPVWPLERFVAVNPYLGISDLRFEQAAAQLAHLGGIQMTLPVDFYLEQLERGIIRHDDLQWALGQQATELSVTDFLKQLRLGQTVEHTSGIPTAADVAAEISGKNWPELMAGRISVWAAAYFDEGQAQWAPRTSDHLFASWQMEACADRTPELTGLKGFRMYAKILPTDPTAAIAHGLEILQVPADDQVMYFHRLLLRVGGWAAYTARLDWEANLYGKTGGQLTAFLAVLVSWEACLWQSLPGKSDPLLAQARKKWTQTQAENTRTQLSQRLILQEALDRAAQRQLIQQFSGGASGSKKSTTPLAQAIFCIDVRSEVFRRHLEMANDRIETLGFAGFFAFPIKYVPIGHEQGEAQCPVLLKTGPTILEQLPQPDQHQQAVEDRKLHHAIKRAWKTFKSGAVTCFSFVSPMGILYLIKLLTDSFGWTRPVTHPDQAGLNLPIQTDKTVGLAVHTHGDETVGIPLEQQVQMAKNALTAMSLTSDFARLVLVVGHGSATVNNPHATGLDCGACGGHTGEANAKVAAAVLNQTEIRRQLKDHGIFIPDSTWFVACQHNTTTDEMTIFNESLIPGTHMSDLDILKKALATAGHTARMERAVRMPILDTHASDAVLARSKDWSQVRPEWGLAGCAAFVVAPRYRTSHLDLGGKSFLHSYEWKKDRGFSTLELIMTAPLVVTSWINLQYYASTVDNLHYGAGNKTLHNVTGGVGVLEGYGGDLRTGLPWQSVHDGVQFQHQPLRLSVIIEAPIEAMNMILKKHQGVRDLCDHQWIFLLAMNDTGQLSHRYTGNLQWEAL